MATIVQKFGGTSVADAGRIRRAAERAVAAHRSGHQVVMVVSARGKKTDELISLANEITKRPRPREMDMLLATGEQESVALMAMAIHELGEEAVSMTGSQIGVLTDASHTRARIVRISTQRMRDALDGGQIVIAAGFQGVDENSNITTLGRGGSDTTATALAAALDAELCEIYTDVEGVFTTDPRVVSEAQKVPQISYDEMLELASLGAGVMHSRSIEFAKKYRVTLKVRPSYSDGAGTLIAPEPMDPAPIVTGVAFVREEALIVLHHLPDEPGVMSRIFAHLASRHIAVDMIVQNIASGGTANVSFSVAEADLTDAVAAAEEIVRQLGAGRVESQSNVSKVSVVGHGMLTHTGVAAQMFHAMASAGINIRVVTTSEIKISVLVDRDLCETAVRAAHSGFSLHETIRHKPPVGYTATPRIANDAIVAQSARREQDVSEDELVSRLNGMEEIVVSDVSLDQEQARLTIFGVPDRPGINERIFSAVASGGILVDLIVQNIARGGRANVTFTVPAPDVDACLLLVRELLESMPEARVSHDRRIAKLTVSGIGLRSHTNVGARMFKALAAASINVEMISTSELKVSIVIDAKTGTRAEHVVKAEFGLS